MNLEKEICNEIKAIPQKLADDVFPKISIYILPESLLNIKTYDLDKELINVTFGPFESDLKPEKSFFTDDYERYAKKDNSDEIYKAFIITRKGVLISQKCLEFINQINEIKELLRRILGYIKNLKLLSIDLPYYIFLKIEVKNDLEIDNENHKLERLNKEVNKCESELIKILKKDDNDNIKKKIFGLLNDIKNTFNIK